MKKSDKTELTREKILTAAVKEFGTKGYEGASLNTICSDNGISKGLIYHNFKNKDDLYVCCVGQCIQKFVKFMKAGRIEIGIHEYMELRYRFFSEKPFLSRIFFEAVLQPPEHLAEKIKLQKRELDEFNLFIYQSALRKMTLRPGVTEQEAVSYFSMMQEMFNGYFSNPSYSQGTFSTLVKDHETMLAKMLDFMLYGIVVKEED